MKKLIFLLTLFVGFVQALAQVPEAFSYQAVVRNASGEVISNQPVNFRISILSGSEIGTTIYSETHSVTTNNFGLANLAIGTGDNQTGIFSPGGWGLDAHFIKIEVDPAGGSSFLHLSTTQLLAVPYAFHSQTVEEDQVDDADADPFNELQDISLLGNELSISDGSTVILSDEVNDADADPGNEIQDISISGHDLSISSGSTVTLPDQVDDADADPVNELQDISFVGNELSITGGSTVIIPDEVNDADADPGNELQQISIEADQLSLSKGGGTVTLPSDGDNWGTQTIKSDATLNGEGTLASLLKIAQQGAINGQVLKWDGSDWTPNADETGTPVWNTNGSNIFYNSGNVGIGIENPTNIFELNGGLTCYQRFYNNSTGTGGSDGLLVGIDDFNQSWIHNYENGPLYIGTNGNRVITLKSNGNVGIGTVDPSVNLEVAASNIPQIRLKNTSDGVDNVQKITFWKGSTERFAIGYDLWGTGEDLFTLFDTPNLIPVFNIKEGKVGIRTTQPAYDLDINKSSGNSELRIKSATNGAYLTLDMEGSYASNYANINFKKGGALKFTAGLGYDEFRIYNTDGKGLFIKTNGDLYGNGDLILESGKKLGIGVNDPFHTLSVNSGSSSSYFQVVNNSSGAGYNDGLTFGLDGTTGWLYNAENGPIKFATINGVAMTINVNGKVGLGTTAPGCRLHIKQAGNNYTNGLRLEQYSGSNWWGIQINSSAYNDLVFDYKGTNTRAWISSSDATYHSYSDKSLKYNIVSLKSILQKVVQLNPVTFLFNSEPASAPMHYGFIAQEVQELFPEFVSENDGKLGLAYSNFGIIAIKAIQEQQQMIDKQQQLIKKLNAENEQIIQRLKNLENHLNVTAVK